MSEQILKALMELFAIIARPESYASDRRTVVSSFLKRQLNQELVKDYLEVFDEYYSKHQTLHIERGAKRIGPDSVKILRICDQINKELAQKQKIIVLVRLFEFVNSDNDEITNQEFEFIKAVAESFYIQDTEYSRIKEFTIYPFETIPNSSKILIIDNYLKYAGQKNKHIYSEFLEGQLRILHVDTANMYLMRYIGENEMYLNGQLLQEDKVHVLYTGSSIRNHHIKPIYFSDIVSAFDDERRKSKIVFEIKNISYQFRNGKYGLHKLSFTEESGKLVGIMGASGAGKSTLLNVLNGSAQPTTGKILINGKNIHNEKDKVEGLIGHVSQDDLLIEELTVYQNLYYNAKLCFDNYTEKEIRNAVNKVLQNLGLYEIKDFQVGTPLNKKISGGQRKRLNIALELIREPAVLFLDEPTSGLSSRDSENIMDLLKDLTLKGKLVFVVIHQPSSDIFKMLDQLLILDTGGYLIYNGDPIDSIIYFKSRVHHANWSESECHECGNVNPEQVFNIVESLVIDEYGKQTETRKISPREWNKYYMDYFQDKDREISVPKELPSISFKIPNKLKQCFVFAIRDILSKLANTQYLIITFLEAPLLAFLLSFIIKYRDVSETNELGYTFIGNSNLPVYIFMSVIVAIFMGLTLSAEEIIKDRKILKREAFLNLSWSSYLFSKASVMFIISAIQAMTFVIIGNGIMEIKGMYFQYWLVLFSAWASSNIMGLLISDSFKTVVTIYILIPFLVIPQIILSGVMVKYEKLNPSISSPGRIPVYGEMMTARWGFEALSVYQFMENDYDRQFYDFNKIMSIAEFKKNYWVQNLLRKVDYLEKHYDDPANYEKIQSHLLLLRNEINKEMEKNKVVKFAAKDSLYYDKLSISILNQTREYLKDINRLYIRVYNKWDKISNDVKRDLEKTPEMKRKFIQLKRDYHNDRLTEFVENSNEVVRIIEYKGHLYQKIDPIYLDPENKFVKAHFYSPRKKVFGKYYSTFWINIIVIWTMTFILFLILYFRGLKRFLDFMEHLSSTWKRN
jgi:ABC-type multidrug transport system ATPase subunit/uncharacterized tellurite resistance protein B-like protein